VAKLIMQCLYSTQCASLSLSVSLNVSLPELSLFSCSLSTERCQTGQWYLPDLAQTNKPVLRVNCSPSTDPGSGHHIGMRLFYVLFILICYLRVIKNVCIRQPIRHFITFRNLLENAAGHHNSTLWYFIKQ